MVTNKYSGVLPKYVALADSSVVEQTIESSAGARGAATVLPTPLCGRSLITLLTSGD